MRFLSRNYWYEIALRRPKGEARHVAVVTIGADVPAGFAIVTTSKTPQNLSLVCQRRLYETALLHALSAFHPKVIVADMWLDPKGCIDADVTNILLDEIANQCLQFRRKRALLNAYVFFLSSEINREIKRTFFSSHRSVLISARLSFIWLGSTHAARL